MESKINIQKLLTTEEKIKIYSIYYGTDTNTNLSLEKKFELLKLICLLTKLMKEKDEKKYPNALTVLSVLYNKDLINCNGNDSFELYLIKLSILCDDLLYGTNDKLSIPEGCKTGTDIAKRIKDLINEWLPF